MAPNRTRRGAASAAVAMVLLAGSLLAVSLPARAGGDEPAAIVEAGLVDFKPKKVTIRVGQTVLWRNPVQMIHSVTADPSRAEKKSNVRLPDGAEPFDSGELQPGATFKYTFTVAGTYEYICVPHEAVGMKGTVVVTR